MTRRIFKGKENGDVIDSLFHFRKNHSSVSSNHSVKTTNDRCDSDDRSSLSTRASSPDNTVRLHYQSSHEWRKHKTTHKIKRSKTSDFGRSVRVNGANKVHLPRKCSHPDQPNSCCYFTESFGHLTHSNVKNNTNHVVDTNISSLASIEKVSDTRM